MAGESDQMKAMLGAICAAGDTPMRRKTKKLDSVDVGSAEAFYMLAAYCFDLQRKLEYICKATLDFESRTDSALAKEILADNEALQAEGLSWKQRAELAEEIMLRVYRQISAQHEKGLREAASG